MQGITPLVNRNAGCDYHRIYLPLIHMGVNVEGIGTQTFGEVLPETKVLFYNRTPLNQDVKLFKTKAIKHGFKIVVDLDDYWELYPDHILYKSWVQNKTGEKIAENLRIADAVIVTTDRLAERVRPLNKNVHVIPNALPYDIGQFNDKKEYSDLTRYLYAGGSTHFKDIQVLKSGFNKVLNNPAFKNTQFILAGVNTANKESEVFWNKMIQSFSLNKRMPNFAIRGTLPLETYMEHYEHSDVTLIPLEENTFNRYKSNLKILESAAKYAPVICSGTPPYSDFPGRNMIDQANNAASWFDAMKFFAQNPSAVKEQGQLLGEYCREHYNLLKWNEYRRQLFEHLSN